jgi:CheY-like chemotaxis protein
MPNEQQPLSGCRVLIVEDEYFLAADLQAALKSLGANVIALVGDLDEALDLLTNGGFDIAVVDINLRGRLAARDSVRVRDRLQRRYNPSSIRRRDPMGEAFRAKRSAQRPSPTLASWLIGW